MYKTAQISQMILENSQMGLVRQLTRVPEGYHIVDSDWNDIRDKNGLVQFWSFSGRSSPGSYHVFLTPNMIFEAIARDLYLVSCEILDVETTRHSKKTVIDGDSSGLVDRDGNTIPYVSYLSLMFMNVNEFRKTINSAWSLDPIFTELPYRGKRVEGIVNSLWNFGERKITRKFDEIIDRNSENYVMMKLKEVV